MVIEARPEAGQNAALSVKKEGVVKQEGTPFKAEDEMQAEADEPSNTATGIAPHAKGPEPLGAEVDDEGEDTAEEVQEARPVPLRERMSRVQYALSFLVLPKTIAESLFQDEVLYIPLEPPRETTSYPMSASGPEEEAAALYGTAMMVEGQQPGHWHGRDPAPSSTFTRSSGGAPQQQQQQPMAWGTSSGLSRSIIQHSTASLANPALIAATNNPNAYSNSSSINNSSNASDGASSPSNLLRSNVFPTMNRASKVMAMVGPLAVDPRAVSFRNSNIGATAANAATSEAGQATGENAHLAQQ